MKKIIAVLLCFIFVLSFAACGEKTPQEKPEETNTTIEELNSFSVYVNADEYSLYKKIFYDGKAEKYADKTYTKTGTFTVLYDAFNKTERYYVWGCNKDNKSEDWQWEIKIDDKSPLPSNGSLVEVSGKFEKDEAALDGYWLTAPEITVKEAYEASGYDIDMSVMSATLERVQISNIQNLKEEFEGKKVALYARVATENLVKHPYNDESWQMHFSTDSKVPEADTMVILAGTFTGGIVDDAKLIPTTNY